MTDDKFIAALWAVVGAVTISAIRWVAGRIVVPRDSVTKKYFEDLTGDVAALTKKVDRVETLVHTIGERVARLEGQRNE